MIAYPLCAAVLATRAVFIVATPRGGRPYPSGSAPGAIPRDPGGRRATSSDVTAVSTIAGLQWPADRPLWGESARHFKRKCSDGWICCKTRKLQGHKFFAKRRYGK